MVTHEPDMAAYARRTVRFVDGRVDADTPNPSPVAIPAGVLGDRAALPAGGA